MSSNLAQDNILEILSIAYDYVHKIKNSNAAIIKHDHKVGVYDTIDKVFIIEPGYFSYKFKGPAVVLTSLDEYRTLLYIIPTGQVLGFSGLLESTRVVGAVKAYRFEEGLLVLGRGNGRIIYYDSVTSIFYTQDDTADKIAISVVNKKGERIIIRKNGYIESLHNYLKSEYKSVYLIDKKPGGGTYLAVDNAFIGWVLNDSGTFNNKVGKVVDVQKLSKLKEVT